jgi:hypothetical protein
MKKTQKKNKNKMLELVIEIIKWCCELVTIGWNYNFVGKLKIVFK